jgi:hypothetical protein
MKYKSREYVKKLVPIPSIGLIKILFENHIIDSQLYFEKSLCLFKFKEIDYLFKLLSKENLDIKGERQLLLVDRYKRSCQERFQIYKDPLVKEYKELVQKGCIKV